MNDQTNASQWEFPAVKEEDGNAKPPSEHLLHETCTGSLGGYLLLVLKCYRQTKVELNVARKKFLPS